MFLNLLIVFGTSHTLSTSSWTVECTLWPAFESGSPFYENKMSFLGNKTYKAAVAHGFSMFTFLCLPLPDSLPGKHWQLMGCSGERPALIDCQQPAAQELKFPPGSRPHLVGSWYSGECGASLLLSLFGESFLSSPVGRMFSALSPSVLCTSNDFMRK